MHTTINGSGEGGRYGNVFACLMASCLGVFLLAGAGSARAGILFQEVTSSAGIAYSGESYGVSWGDFDGDGLPDIWVNNHLQQPDLYRNNGNGTFTDILLDVWSADPLADTHGGSWADFDNDGDQDLLNLVGAQGGVGEGANQFFVNENGMLSDLAASYGLEYRIARGRTALWVDWNRDGLLDVVLSNNRRPDGQAPSALYEQTAGGFLDVSAALEFDVSDQSNYAQLTELNGDGVLDLVSHGVDYPQRVYDVSQQPIVDLNDQSGLIAGVSDVWDSAIADFDGDLFTDIFVTRVADGRLASDLFQEDGQTIKFRLLVRNEEKGVSFRTDGDVVFHLYQTPVGDIRIGSSGVTPPGTTFTLSPGDPDVAGVAPYVPGSDTGVYIGYDQATQTWTLMLSASGSDAMNGIIQTANAASDTAAVGFSPDAPQFSDRLLLQSGTGLVDMTEAAGLSAPTFCYSVVAGDLDNDMDVDLYLVCNRPVANLPNILYENNGDGSFTAVAAAGGAEGSTQGRGENAALADYDGDGYLDIFLTNGMFNDPFNVGPQQLFRNQGGGNHWIQLDLEGVMSNRDGIGARVFVVAGGVTQVREQSAGIHRHAQNFKRIHVGLGSNETVEEIRIHWPGGAVQRLNNVAADQVLAVREVAPELTVDDVLIDERAGTLQFNVRLSAPSAFDVSVLYTTRDGTALAGQDYAAVSGQLVFRPGELVKHVEVPLVADDIDETQETFEIVLDAASGALIGDDTGMARIVRFSTWFEDVTQASGMVYSGQSYGSAWGDFDADGWPDLLAGNHQNPPSLYINQGDGTFLDRAAELFPEQTVRHDLHGAAWADYDNDGDQDLVQVAGFRDVEGGTNFLFENQAGMFSERALELGVALPEHLARTPLWLDWNLDGMLDLLISNDVNQPQDPLSVLLTQTGAGFMDESDTAGLAVADQSSFALLSDLSGDGRMELVLRESPGPLRILDMTTMPFQDVTAQVAIPNTSRILDMVAGDFNNDLAMDLLAVRGETGGSDILVDNQGRLVVRLLYEGQQQLFRIRADGDVTFTLYGPDIQPLLVSDVFIGASGQPPLTVPTFTLSSADSSTWGLAAFQPGVNDGVRIGYDQALNEWVVAYTGGRRLQLNAIIGAATDLALSSYSGFEAFAPVTTNRLFLNEGGTFVNATNSSGVAIDSNCTSGASADFDNDMDLDIFIVCTGVLSNLPDLYLENQGDGTFVPLVQGAGAAGDSLGRGDSVTVADFDRDGFPDIFVSNGMSLAALTPFNGPHQLFRNLGNQNHWIELDLVGVESTRDAVGARVLLTTPDGVTQVREQAGGGHRASQNHPRIHFGLGSNTEIQSITVHWPGGAVEVLENIQPDQVLQLVEGAGQVNSAPSIQGLPGTQVDAGGFYRFVPSASDADAGDELLFSIVNKPVWAQFDVQSGELSGTPGPADVGVHSGIRISVDDQRGAVNSVAALDPFDLLVTQVNAPPAVASGSIFVVQKDSASVAITVEDPDPQDTHDFEVLQAGSLGGVATITASGLVTYNADNASVGTEELGVRVTDSAGNSIELAVFVTVNAADQPDSNKDGMTDAQALRLGLDPADPDGDTDDDGVPDVEEAGHPEPSLASDSDGDGVIDALEAGDAATDSSLASNSVLQIVSEGQVLSNVQVEPVGNAPQGVQFPLGMVSYQTTASPASQVTLRFTFSAELPVHLALYKVDALGNFIELPTSLWRKLDTHSIEFDVTDGDGLTDQDGQENGMIVDPLAPAEVTTAGGDPVDPGAPPGGGGGGCALARSDAEPDWSLLLLLCLLGMVRVRRLVSAR